MAGHIRSNIYVSEDVAYAGVSWFLLTDLSPLCLDSANTLSPNLAAQLIPLKDG